MIEERRRMSRLAVAILILLIAFLVISLFEFHVEAAAEQKEKWLDYVELVSEQHGICPELVEAIIEQESSWDPNAENGDCIGLMQISEHCHKDRMERLGVTDLHDPYDNILVGVDYLTELFERYEDCGMVLDTYNGSSEAQKNFDSGTISGYASRILDRSAELERAHGK